MKSDKKKLSICCVLLLGVILIGCGGGGNDSNDNPQPDTIVPTMPEKLFRIVPANDFSLLDFSSDLKETESEIINVSKIDDLYFTHCPEPSTSVTGFSAHFLAGELCSYNIETVNKDNELIKTQIDVFSSNAEAPLLPAKSQTALITDGQKSIDIEAALGPAWPVGFSLSDKVIVTDSEESGANASVEGNTINVTLGSSASVITVVYNLVDKSDTNNVMLGHVFVTVSNEAVSEIIITPKKYNYKLPLLIDHKYEFDIKSFPDLTIQSADEWYLHDITGLNVNVRKLHGNRFEIRPSVNGVVELTYILLKRGGGVYSAGHLFFDVNYVENPATWTDVTYRYASENIRWISPTVPSDVSSISQSRGSWDSGVNNTVAIFTAEAAARYCSRVGRLPYDFEFAILRNKTQWEEAEGDIKLWPQKHLYWSLNPTTQEVGKTQLLDTRVDDAEIETLYTACVVYDEMLMDTLVSELSGSTPVKVGIVRTPKLVSSSKYEMSIISETLTEDDMLLSMELKDDKSFFVVVSPTALATKKSGIFRVLVQKKSGNHDQVKTLPIYFNMTK